MIGPASDGVGPFGVVVHRDFAPSARPWRWAVVRRGRVVEHCTDAQRCADEAAAFAAGMARLLSMLHSAAAAAVSEFHLVAGSCSPGAREGLESRVAAAGGSPVLNGRREDSVG